MAIAMLNHESWLPSRGPGEPALTGEGGPDTSPAVAPLPSPHPSQASPWDALLSGATSSARVPFYKPMPTADVFALRPEAFAPALRGYAPSSSVRQTTASLASAASATAPSGATAKSSGSQKSSTSKTTSTKASTSKATSKASTSKEFAFLDDKKLSIEDKLFQFMALMTKKNDQELVDAMKQYETKKAAQSTSSGTSEKTSSSSGAKPVPSQGGGGGLFGFLGDALGGIGKAIVGGAESLAKDLGGPVLAGVATAVGMPFLAPVALQVGGQLSAGLIEGVASTVGLGKSSSSGSSSASKSGSSSSGSKTGSASSGTKTSSSTKSSTTKSSTSASEDVFDEKFAMFELQRLVEKQNAMFSALSNAMKSMHESQMTAVQNIR